jgi:hypothetical protein
MATQKVSLPPRSAFVSTPVYQLDDGTIVFGLQRPVTLADSSDKTLTVPAQFDNRLDLVSFELYGVPDFWYAIAQASAIADPLMGAPEGATLRAPLKSRLPSA